MGQTQKPWQLEQEGLTGPEEGRTRVMEVLDSRAVSAAGPAPGGLADTSWGFGLCPVMADLKAERASTEGHQGVAAGLCIPSSRERLRPSKLPCQGQQVHNISRPSLSTPPSTNNPLPVQPPIGGALTSGDGGGERDVGESEGCKKNSRERRTLLDLTLLH